LWYGKKELAVIDTSDTQQLRCFVFYVWMVIEYYLRHHTRHLDFTGGNVIFINQRVQRRNIVIGYSIFQDRSEKGLQLLSKCSFYKIEYNNFIYVITTLKSTSC